MKSFNCDCHTAGLIALAMIVGATMVLTMHGMKDETLLAILATGAVGIANAIVGIKAPGAQPPQNPQIPQLPQVSQLPQQTATIQDPTA